MKHDAFDESLRRRAQEELFEISAEADARVARAIRRGMRVDRKPQRATWVAPLTAAVAACISEYLLCAGRCDLRGELLERAAAFRAENAFLLFSADLSGILIAACTEETRNHVFCDFLCCPFREGQRILKISRFQTLHSFDFEGNDSPSRFQEVAGS